MTECSSSIIDEKYQGYLEDIRNKLLDLTSNNRLLNFPITQKSVLRIINEPPDRLYQAIISEQVMQFAPFVVPASAQLQQFGYLEKNVSSAEKNAKQALSYPDAKTWAGKLSINTSYELPYSVQNDISHKDSDEFERDPKAAGLLPKPSVHTYQIQTLYYPDDLEAVLFSIHGKAQSAIEEMGADILYLSLGFLQWYESEDSYKVRLAPLFIVPVKLEKGKRDFSIALPDLDNEMLPESYFKKIQAIIEKDKPRWKVHRYRVLGILEFRKMLMHQDLDPKRWP